MTRIHRPYARKRGGPPSVTTVLGALDKPGLPWAAARETALFAVNHRDEWEGRTEADAVDRLYRHHRGIWDHRAALGTLVHSVNEMWACGEDIDLETMVLEVQAKGRVWADRATADVLAEAEIMVDGLEAAWTALQPETISVEDVVRYTGGGDRQLYIGQSDWRARIAGTSYLIDVKTTGKTEAGEALYWDSWRLQLAAYRNCTELVRYDDGANEIGTEKLARVEAAAILHIRANGDWALLPVAAGQTEMNMFLRLRDLYGWLHKDGTKAGADAFNFELMSALGRQEATA